MKSNKGSTTASSEGTALGSRKPDDALSHLDLTLADLVPLVDYVAPLLKSTSTIPDSAKELFAKGMLETILQYEGIDRLLAVFGQPLSTYPGDYAPPDYAGKIAPSWPDSLKHTAYFQTFQYEYPESYEEYDDVAFNDLFYRAVTGLVQSSREACIQICSCQPEELAMGAANLQIRLSPMEALDVAKTILQSLRVARNLWSHEKWIVAEEHRINLDYQQMLEDEEQAMEYLFEAHERAWRDWESDWAESERLRLHDSGYDEESFWEQETI